MTDMISTALYSKMEDTLRRLGINRHYKGYPRMFRALALSLEDDGRLCMVTREIYCVVAEDLGGDWRAVECSLRTIIRRAWRVNRPFLEEIAGYPLPKPPTCSEFLEMLTVYFQRNPSPRP